jgi:hypothetical protein
VPEFTKPEAQPPDYRRIFPLNVARAAVLLPRLLIATPADLTA